MVDIGVGEISQQQREGRLQAGANEIEHGQIVKWPFRIEHTRTPEK